jgi:hypothetical protein
MWCPAPAANSPLRYAAHILASIVGDYTGSRLFWALVDRGLCESADMGFYEYEAAGAFITSFSCQPERTAECRALALKILHDVQKNGVTEDELKLARTKLASREVRAGERTHRRMLGIGRDWTYLGQYRSLDDELAAIDAVDLKTIRELLDRYRLDNLTTVALGPLATPFVGKPPVAEMPMPTEAHRLFEKLAGSWIGNETIYPGPMDPVGGKAVSRYSARIGVNGLALISDYEQERGGEVTFRGHAVFTYEPQSGDYVMHWVDTMGTPPEMFRGKLTDNTLTLRTHNSMGHARLVYDVSAPRRFRSRMEISNDGENWMPFSDTVYTLLPRPPAPASAQPRAPERRHAAKKKAPAKKMPAPAKKTVAKQKPVKTKARRRK